MGGKNLNTAGQNSAGNLEVDGPWFKKRWFRSYKLRVRITEREIGGELYAC